jgi:hypothetical protein
MCKTCTAHLNTIAILQTQLDRAEERIKSLELKLGIFIGFPPRENLSNTLMDAEDNMKEPRKSHTTWSETRAILEARDMKRLRELNKLEES